MMQTQVTNNTNLNIQCEPGEFRGRSTCVPTIDGRRLSHDGCNRVAFLESLSLTFARIGDEFVRISELDPTGSNVYIVDPRTRADVVGLYILTEKTVPNFTTTVEKVEKLRKELAGKTYYHDYSPNPQALIVDGDSYLYYQDGEKQKIDVQIRALFRSADSPIEATFQVGNQIHTLTLENKFPYEEKVQWRQGETSTPLNMVSTVDSSKQ